MLQQTYRKLADLRLGNASCSFAEFAIAELSVNLRCPALPSSLPVVVTQSDERHAYKA